MKKTYEELSSQYGFIDEYDRGCGWWSNVETQARILARERAWASIGIACIVWLKHYTIDPNMAKLMDMDLTFLDGVGLTTVIKISRLPESASDDYWATYNRLYNNKESWIWKFAEENFKRIGKRHA